MTQNRRRLVFLDRNKRRTSPSVSASTNLFPRDILAGHADALAAYDDYINAIAARQNNYREARKLREEAAASVATYKVKVREALTSGKPTDKLKENSAELIAKAEAHEALAREADNHLINLGNTLGQQVAAVAPELFPPAEHQMEAAAERVRADIVSLRESWGQWSGAWQVRRIIGDLHYYGGRLNNYDPNVTLPTEVAHAIHVIDEHLHHLDTLRQDERDLEAWRAQEAKAQGQGAAEIAGESEPVFY